MPAGRSVFLVCATLVAVALQAAEPVRISGYSLARVAPFEGRFYEADRSRMWVFVERSRITLWEGIFKLGAVADLPPREDYATETACAVSNEDELFLWITISYAKDVGGVYLVSVSRTVQLPGPQGKDFRFIGSLKKLAGSDLGIDSVTAAPDGHVWMNGRTMSVAAADGSDFRSLDNTGIPAGQPRQDPRLHKRQPWWGPDQVFPSPRGLRAWKLTQVLDGAIVADGESRRMHHVAGGMRFYRIIPIGDGRFAWAIDFRYGLHLLSAGGEVITLGKELLDGKQITGSAVTGADQNELWLSVGSELIAVAVENGRPVIRHRYPPVRGSLGSIATDDGKTFWALSSDAGLRVLIVGSDGKLTATTMAPAGDRRILTTAGTNMCITVRGELSGVSSELWSPHGSVGKLTAPMIYPLDQNYRDPPFFMILPGGVNGDVAKFVAEPPITHASLELGGQTLATDAHPATLRVGDKIENLRAQFTVRGRKKPLPGQIRLHVRTAELAHATPWIEVEDVTAKNTIQLNLPVNHGVAYDISVEFSSADQSGAALVTWPKIEFVAPLIEQRWFRTLLVYFAIVLAAALLFLMPFGSIGFRSWIPIVVMLLPSATVFADHLANQIHVPMLIALLVGTIVIATASGLLSPVVYRAFARLQPLRALTPLALRWPSFRRRLFAPYAQRLREQLEKDSAEANLETYVAIPARFTAKDDDKGRVEAAPAVALAQALTRRNSAGEATHVVIEGPGGGGKSALFRATLIELLNAFDAEARSPLPILGKPAGESIEVIVEAALARYAITSELVAAELSGGRMIVALDGVSESSLAPEIIDAFVRSEEGAVTPLFVTTRPNDRYRKPITAADHWIRAEPQRLDDDTLPLFEAKYLNADSSQRALTKAMKDLCRTEEGGYLPILVRLALMSKRDVEKVADLYEEVCHRLLRIGGESQEVIDRASALCVATYWKTGDRTLPFARAPEEQRTLLKTLLDAGLLIAADSRFVSPSIPIEVRFFHDSMQTYLTARGLANDDSQPAEAVLLEAAADPRFLRAEDALYEWATEIFRMFLQAVARDRARRVLNDALQRWSINYREDLKMIRIRNAMPRALRQQLPENAVGVTALLETARALCDRADDPIAALGRLFAGLAPYVRKAEMARQPAA
jgi:hypothetical protein